MSFLRNLLLLFILSFLLALPNVCDAEEDSVTDPDTVVIINLFKDACIPRVGKLDEIRAWAASKKFPEMVKSEMLDALLAPSGKGTGWIIPTPESKPRLALSINDATQACAVWAERANPQQVTDFFIKLMKETESPNIIVKKINDRTDPNKYGIGHTIVYELSNLNSPVVVDYLLSVNNKPGGAIQVSMQVNTNAVFKK